ncbi:hypothetical protein [Isoptericola sp. NPDC057191]|uniref:hypothetical protein n=1 Tax=Isoptericola sp. NPDC057191 TaxID=3346041 RepID=UPI00362D57B0
MNTTATLTTPRGIGRRYRQDPPSYYDGLRMLGIRDVSIMDWIQQMLSDPERFAWTDDIESPLTRLGWRPTDYWEFLDRWEPAERYWIPRSGAYLAFGYYDEAGLDNGRTWTNAVPGWRISAKVTRTRFVVKGIVDSYDGERIEEIGSLPLPCCARTTIRRRVCQGCFLELPLSGRCADCA